MRLLSPTRRFIFLQKGHDATSIAVAGKSEEILSILATNSVNRRQDTVSGTELFSAPLSSFNCETFCVIAQPARAVDKAPAPQVDRWLPFAQTADLLPAHH